MISSMTGFGAASGDVAGIPVRVEIRTVNHRGLDISVRLPPSLAAFEPPVTSWCRGTFTRGHVEISVRGENHEIPVNTEKLFATRAASLKRILSACKLPESPTLQELLALGLPVEEPREFDEATWQSFRAVLVSAASIACETRVREGQFLGARLGEIAERVGVLGAAIRERYPLELAAFRVRQEARLASQGGARTTHEKEPVSLLVFGRDAAEELDRLDAHVAEVKRALAAGGPMGRRFDFLATEMLREAATLTSKCPSPDLSRLAIDLRCELERLREQAQNIE